VKVLEKASIDGAGSACLYNVTQFPWTGTELGEGFRKGQF
jgi:hypothetical protein